HGSCPRDMAEHFASQPLVPFVHRGLLHGEIDLDIDADILDLGPGNAEGLAIVRAEYAEHHTGEAGAPCQGRGTNLDGNDARLSLADLCYQSVDLADL